MEYNVHFQFNTQKIPIEELRKVEKIFSKYGLHFDTGAGGGWRDWFLDTESHGKEGAPLEIFVDEMVQDS